MARGSADNQLSPPPPPAERDRSPNGGLPEDLTPRRVSWHFSQRAFERFLQALDADRNVAAERYEQIRAKLLRFFEWRGCSFPDELADETITRVIRKIDEGDSIQDPGSYCYGVARLVLLEALKRREKERDALSRFRPSPAEPEDDETEQRLECLRSCISAIPRDQQAMIGEYYREDSAKRIDVRKKLAKQLGIGVNALRIRAHRVSDRLEHCVVECMRRRSAS
jgi:DNA-directed RNA polymerase specialized sigma24 family protein